MNLGYTHFTDNTAKTGQSAICRNIVDEQCTNFVLQNAKQILRWWRARDGLSLFETLSVSKNSRQKFVPTLLVKQSADRSSGARAGTPSTTTACNCGSLMPHKVKAVSHQLASCTFSKLRRGIFQEIQRKRHYLQVKNVVANKCGYKSCTLNLLQNWLKPPCFKIRKPSAGRNFSWEDHVDAANLWKHFRITWSQGGARCPLCQAEWRLNKIGSA